MIPIRLPALRERADDMPLIADHFLSKYTREMGKPINGITPEALESLKAYPWPGNVRELENVIERAVALESTDRIRVETLADQVRAGRPATPMPRNVRDVCRSRASTWNTTSRTSSAAISNGRCGSPTVCRRARRSCSGSASGSSAIWRRSTA